VSESGFRSILIAGLALIVPLALSFRLRAQTDEKLDRLQEGWFILLGIRLPGVTHMLSVLAYAWNPTLLAWSQVALPIGVRLLGVPLGILGGALLLWTFTHLGKNLTDTVVVRRDATLVTSGPYARVRHPFYGAVFLGMLANTLLTASWLVGLAGWTTLVFIRLRVGLEEQRLVERFGDDYRAYMRRVPRFIPRL